MMAEPLNTWLNLLQDLNAVHFRDVNAKQNPDKFNPKTARFFDEEGIERTLTAKADKLYMSAIPSAFKEQNSGAVDYVTKTSHTAKVC